MARGKTSPLDDEKGLDKEEGTVLDVFDEALAAIGAKNAADTRAKETYLAAQKKYLELESLRYGASNGSSRLSRIIARIIGSVRRYGPTVAALGGGGGVIGSVVTALTADEGGFGDVTSLLAVIGQLFGE